jgi:hypothetical protein
MNKQPTKRQIKIIMKAFGPPKGWRVIQRGKMTKDNAGFACPINRCIVVKTVTDVETLGVFLHECAHVHLGHVLIKNRNIANPPGSNFKRHIHEAEAEIWSMMVLKIVGFPAPKWYFRAAQAYVRYTIGLDRKFKRPINKEVEAWANMKV